LTSIQLTYDDNFRKGRLPAGDVSWMFIFQHDYDEKLTKAEADNEKLQKLYTDQEKQVREVR